MTTLQGEKLFFLVKAEQTQETPVITVEKKLFYRGVVI
jgi:hypothetical protein